MRGDRLGGPPGAFLLARAGAKWRPQPATCGPWSSTGAILRHTKWRLNYETPLQAENPGLSRMPNAKSIGWAIYAAGFVVWLFGYLSAGHASAFDWDAATPWWISSFVPNLEAELGLALMFASMIPIYWRAGRKRA